jgi:hypothetical protein
MPVSFVSPKFVETHLPNRSSGLLTTEPVVSCGGWMGLTHASVLPAVAMRLWGFWVSIWLDEMAQRRGPRMDAETWRVR